MPLLEVLDDGPDVAWLLVALDDGPDVPLLLEVLDDEPGVSLLLEAPDDEPGVPLLLEAPDDEPDVPWLLEAPDEDPAEAGADEEAVLVVGALLLEPAVLVVGVLLLGPVGDEAVVVEAAAVVVELPDEGAVVVAEPVPGAEAAGATVVPGGEAGPLAPAVLGALFAVEFAEEDGAVLENATGALDAPVSVAPAGAAARAPGCDPGWVAPATGLAMVGASG